MQYAIELSQQQAAVLQQQAVQLNMKAEDLLQSLINQVLARVDEAENNQLGLFIIEIKKPESDVTQPSKSSASNEDDPIEKFIGIAYSDNPDWIDKHDLYLGQEALHSSEK